MINLHSLLSLAFGEPPPPAAESTPPPADISALEPLLFALTELGIFVIIIAICMCLFRVLRGPHLADRVLAGDTVAFQVVALVILLTIRLSSTTYIDAALVVAIIGFASTLAFAQYIGNLPRPVRKQ